MTVRIENWAVVEVGDMYTPPELLKRRLVGTVYGHPRLEDGSEITTSSLREFDLITRLGVTRNTTYSLGKPKADYLELYPEAGL